MKKLLAMVGAVALGAFAWADDVATYTGTDFEAYTAGEATTQAEDNLYYWLPSADTAATATVVEGSSGGNEQIGEWSASDDAQVLKIKTNLTKPLYRSVLGSEELTALSGKSMTDVVFIDAMVKFTSCDEPVEIDENGKLASDSDAKLAVWVLENVEDTDKPTTNLYVTAGFFGDNGLVAKSYDCGPVKDYDIALDGFNRLTVRSIVDITDAGDPGFVVFVNGKPVASEDERGAITYGKVATAWRKKGNVIFPSIDNESLVKDTICGVGFAGQGEVDNITFAKSEESRDFALQPQADVMTVNFSEHVAGVTLTPAKGDAYTVTDADISAGTCVFEVTSESSPVEIAVTFEEGWKSAKAWTTVNSTVELDGNTGTVTFSLDSENLPAVTIVEKSAKVAATVGGEEFDTLAAAIAYVNGLGEGDPVLVKIGDDVASSASEDNNICIDSECARDVVIDLNGKTIYGKNINDGEFLYGVIENDGGNLTIIDSAGGGKVVADATVVEGAAQPSVYMYAGTTVISNGIFVGKALVETAENPTVTIAGGSFDAANNTDENDPEKFALDSYVAKPDFAAGLVGAYWVVAPYVAPDFEGEGTEASPYLIQAVKDLQTLQTRVDEGNTYEGVYFQQTADIDLSSLENWPGIGVKGGTFFKGVYDGGNKTFTGTLHMAKMKYGGLFAYCQTATIKNFTFDADIPAPEGDGEKGFAIIGYAVDGCRMINLTMSGDIGSAQNPCTHNVGGIIVSSEQTSSYFESCTMSGAIYTKGPDNDHVKAGGISALCNGGVNTFTNCVVSGKIVNMTEFDTDDPTDLASIGALCSYMSGKNIIVDCDLSGATLTYTAPSDYVSVAAGGIAGHCGATVEITNTYAKADIQAIGYRGTAEMTQLRLATIDNGKAVYDAANETPDLTGATTYKVMLPGLTFTLANKGDKLALDETLCTATVAAADTEKYEIKKTTAENVNTYECVEKQAAEPVDPEDPKEYADDAAATAAAAAINANKQTLIKAPEGLEAADAVAYKEKFEAVADGKTVTVKLLAEAEAALQKQVDADVVQKIMPAKIADGTATTATLDTTPGFYYTVIAGNGLGTMAPTSCTLATGATLTVDTPKFEGAGFYKIEVSVKPIEIPVAK